MTTTDKARFFPGTGDLSVVGTTISLLPFEINISQFAALEGVKLRVVFYDGHTFSRSKLFKVGEQSNTDTWFKKNNTTPLPDTDVGGGMGSPRKPLVSKGSGVLLVLEGIMRKMRLPAGKPTRWAFVVQDKQENPDPNIGTSAAVTPNEVGRAEQVGRLVWRADDARTVFGRPRILIRVVVAEAGGGFQAGQVFASNLCPDHVFTNPKGEPDPLFANREATPTTTTIGGTAPAGQPPTSPATPRTMSPDLTGFYEVTFPDKDCPLTMYVHQAGHALVGWFQPPAPHLALNNLPTLPAGFPDHAGTFTCTRDSDKAKGPWALKWGNSKDTTTAGKSDNLSDPGDDKSRESNDGTVTVVSKTSEKDVIQQLEFSLTDAQNQTATFTATRRGALWARWPRYLIDSVVRDLPQKIKNSVEGQLKLTSHPVPTSFYDRIEKQLSEKNPALQSAVNAWDKAIGLVTDTAGQRAAIAQMSNVVSGAIGTLNADEKKDAIPKIKIILFVNMITPNGKADRQSILHYIEQMAAFEQSSGSVSDPMFEKVGVGGPPRFAYTLSFDAIGTGDLKLGLGGGAAGFQVSIAKAKIDPSDPNKLTPVTDGQWGDNEKFVGAFGNIGAGIAFEGSTPKSKGGAGGAFPDKVVLRTFLDLGLESFDGALFSVCGVTAGKLGWSAFKYTGFSSAHFSLTLQDEPGGLPHGATLDADIEKINDGPSIAIDLQTFVDFLNKPGETIDKFGLKGVMPSVTVTAFTVSMGWGYFGTPKNLLKTVEPPPEVRADPKKVGEPLFGMRTHFDLNSGLISDPKRNDLERALAVHRIMFTEADADVWIDAFASPEDSKPHNVILTKARAAATAMAIRDAFGTMLTVKERSMKQNALGEDPSEKVGLLVDPETCGKGHEADIERQTREEYWFWRRTDLWAVGKLIIRITPD